MRMFNNIIVALKTPIPLCDRVLEIVALAMLLIQLVLTAVVYHMAPAEVPYKFNRLIEPIEWIDKEIYWYIAILFVVLILITSASAYEIRLINLPVRLKEPVLVSQKRLIFRMSRCITLCVELIWLSYLLISSITFFNLPKVVLYVMSYSSFTLLIGVIIYFSVKVWWIGRKY